MKMIGTLEDNVRKLCCKHFPEAAVENSTAFTIELAEIVTTVINKTVNQQTKDGAFISTRELENLVLTVRDLRAKYETQERNSTSDVIKLDELKQTEYRLTEHILSNR